VLVVFHRGGGYSTRQDAPVQEFWSHDIKALSFLVLGHSHGDILLDRIKIGVVDVLEAIIIGRTIRRDELVKVSMMLEVVLVRRGASMERV
jgi:hypothetical protein